MCNLIAKQPSFYCIEHKESTNKNKKINNINQNEKLNCSGINNKGGNCKAGAKLKIGDNWYCFNHKNQAKIQQNPVQSESDDDTEDDDEENDKIDNSILIPVLSNQDPSNMLKLVKCNGKFNNNGDKLCDIFIYSDLNETLWFCPIHQKQNEKITTKKEDTKIEPEKFDNIEAKLSLKVNTEERIIAEKKPIEKSDLIDDKNEKKSKFKIFSFCFFNVIFISNQIKAKLLMKQLIFMNH